ncbi:MAG: MoaD/ThiS family protein [Planctomycetota bacterium]
MRDSTPSTVRLFGPQADLTGQREIQVEVTPGRTTSADVLQQLGDKEPALAESLPDSRLAVNHEYADPGAPLRGDEELALIGLVGGG